MTAPTTAGLVEGLTGEDAHAVWAKAAWTYPAHAVSAHWEGLNDQERGAWAVLAGYITEHAVRAYQAQSAVPAPGGEIAWLLEWPHPDEGGARWWHPETGWRFDPNKALRFARKEDAEAYRRSQLGFPSGLIATEHKWLPSPPDTAQGEG